jgi:hypothetical protein
MDEKASLEDRVLRLPAAEQPAARERLRALDAEIAKLDQAARELEKQAQAISEGMNRRAKEVIDSMGR